MPSDIPILNIAAALALTPVFMSPLAFVWRRDLIKGFLAVKVLAYAAVCASFLFVVWADVKLLREGGGQPTSHTNLFAVVFSFQAIVTLVVAFVVAARQSKRPI